nr:DEAD/DEAH box helicase [Microcella frigidaquae]
MSPAYPERAARGTADRLRAWQAEALDRYFETEPRDFLAAATPGAGKTTFALRLAAELLARRTVERVIVVAPTEHLKRQWADAAHRVGIRLDPAFRNAGRVIGRAFHGAAVTYAQVAMQPFVHRTLVEQASTLVILDEVHHGGDALSWGEALRDAYSGATRRLSLSGTPFRSDTAPIPFVSYVDEGDGVRVSRTDYSYGYGRALEDGVVRPVLFLSYAGRMRWRTSTGEEMEAVLGQDDTADITAQAWRTALDPGGEWMSGVLRAADTRLTEVRHAIPDAGGLVIATDQSTARAYAQLLADIAGEEPVVVLSDEAGASERIAEFAESDARWLVAVRMVSEGVDVPRLAVGVYATSASTPLFFAQAVGRFVRARRRGETASIFIPSVPVIQRLAGELERERDHALDRVGDELLEDSLLTAAEREEKASEEELTEFAYLALESSATFDKVLYDGDEFGLLSPVGSLEELDFLGLPGILEPDQVREVLKARHQRQQRRAAERPSAVAATAPQPLYRSLKEQRALLNSLVGLRAKLTGQPHGHIHAELRRLCGGPAVNQATVAQLQARIDLLRRKLHSA